MSSFKAFIAVLVTSALFVMCSRNQPQTVPSPVLGQTSVPGSNDQVPSPEPDPAMPEAEEPIQETPPGDAGVGDPQEMPADAQQPSQPQPPGDAGVDAQPGTSAPPMGPQPPTDPQPQPQPDPGMP
jgi:hypothetical protein